MKIDRRFVVASVALAFSGLSLVGCTPLETRSPVHMANPFTPLSMADKTEVDEEEDEVGVPETMAVIWTDSIYSAPGAQPTRGFGGRFYFYDANGETIRVNGELSVFGFDDTMDDSQTKVPQKKFVYPADQLQSHASVTDLGISYSFWIPWDAIGGERKAISLLPILKTPEGKIIRGEQTINVLPGKTIDAGPSVTSDVNQIRGLMNVQASNAGFFDSGMNQGYSVGQTGMQQPAIDPYQASRARTLTIGVPREMGRSMQGPQAQRSRPQTTTILGPNSTMNTGYQPVQSMQQPMQMPPQQMPMQQMPSQQPMPQTYAPQAYAPQSYAPPASMPTMGYPNAAPQAPPAAGFDPRATQYPGFQPAAQSLGMPSVDPASVMPMNPNSFDPQTNTLTGMGPAPGFRNSSTMYGSGR